MFLIHFLPFFGDIDMQTVSLYFVLNQSYISRELQDILNPNFSTSSFNPGLFNPILFNSLAPKIMVEKFLSGVDEFTIKKFGVE